MVSTTGLALAEACVNRARTAQESFEAYDQQAVDEVVTAVSWAGYSHAETLAKSAVEETGLGNYEDKVSKIRRKTMGTLRDLKGAQSVGVIRVDEERGITEIAKPAGVVAAITPVTNPAATPIHNIMVALKGRNAIILAPHPQGDATGAAVVRFTHEELKKVGAPCDLVQHFHLKAADKALSKLRATSLMRQVDLVVVTAGPANVRTGYSSGTPALGVGRGNVPVIVEATADLEAAADKIVYSKCFDNATSCSSENSLLLEEHVYAEMLNALRVRGGYLVSTEEKALLQSVIWQDGFLNRAIVGQSSRDIAQLAGLTVPADHERFLMVEEEGVGPEYPFSGEKLCPVLTVYRYGGFDEAIQKVKTILDYQGLGHSCGIHSKDETHISQLAHAVKVSRVLVNQAHCIGNGGDFANGLDFTLSMGAGTWGGNSTCDNITYKHLLNITRLSQPVLPRVPTEENLWGEYLRQRGP